jgi:hypothetical protein
MFQTLRPRRLGFQVVPFRTEFDTGVTLLSSLPTVESLRLYLYLPLMSAESCDIARLFATLPNLRELALQLDNESRDPEDKMVVWTRQLFTQVEMLLLAAPSSLRHLVLWTRCLNGGFPDLRTLAIDKLESLVVHDTSFLVNIGITGPSAALRCLYLESVIDTFGVYERLATDYPRLTSLRVCSIRDCKSVMEAVPTTGSDDRLVSIGSELAARSTSFAIGLHTLQARFRDARLFIVVLTALPNLCVGIFTDSQMYNFASCLAERQQLRPSTPICHARLHTLDLSHCALHRIVVNGIVVDNTCVDNIFVDEIAVDEMPTINYWQALTLPNLRILNLSFTPLVSNTLAQLANFSTLLALGLRESLPTSSTPYAVSGLSALEYLDVYHSRHVYAFRDVNLVCSRLSYYHPPLPHSFELDTSFRTGSSACLETFDLDCNLSTPPATIDAFVARIATLRTVILPDTWRTLAPFVDRNGFPERRDVTIVWCTHSSTHESLLQIEAPDAETADAFEDEKWQPSHESISRLTSLARLHNIRV